MQCTNPIRIFKNLNPLEFPDGLTVPCGKCYNCRISKRREWTLRMIHELDSWYDSIFITLTYHDEYLPDNLSLKKTDLQKFIKRLRKRVEPEKIKYFACGEYGNPSQLLPNGKFSIGDRPHYHAIIFGMSIEEKNLIEDSWPFGIVHVGLAEPDSIRYVAQYIDGKLSGEEAEKKYDQQGREHVFRLISQGIGKNYVKKNSEMLINNECITMFGKNMSFPRYYLHILDLDNSDFRKQNAIMKDQKQVEFFTNQKDMTFDDFYKTNSANEVLKLYEAIIKSRKQAEKNTKAKFDLKKRKL